MQTVVVDARGHMLGRLASVLAKQLLNGQQVVSEQPADQLLHYQAYSQQKLHSRSHEFTHTVWRRSLSDVRRSASLEVLCDRK